MKRVSLLLLSLIIVFMASCATKGQTGAGIGAASGAVLGQLIGGNTEATLIGAGVGTLLGYIVGNEMDKYDRQRLNYAYENAQSGQSTSWQNPDNGNRYSVTPEPAYYPPSQPDRPCRKAEILATIDGRAEKTYTTACRNDSGQWVLEN
jgi:surface antigen